MQDNRPTAKKFLARPPRSLGVVKNHPERKALAAAHAAHAVAHVDAVRTARALHGEQEFAAGEILARPREQERELQREGELAVEILVQAVEVAEPIFQQ